VSSKALIAVVIVTLAGLGGAAKTPPGGLDRPILLQSASPTGAAPATPAAETRQLLNRYCVSCHSDRLKTAGLTLQTIDVDNPAHDAATWEKVLRKVRAGAMPPVGRPRPEPPA
jgi:hypothetical protein